MSTLGIILISLLPSLPVQILHCVCGIKTSLQLYGKVHVIHHFLDCGETLNFFFFFLNSTLGRSVFISSIKSRQSKCTATVSGPNRTSEICSVA